MRRVHVIVRGDVQGVGYRYTMRLFAQRFGVAGWVRNLADGSVEAEAEGTSRHVDQMLDWVAHGPPGSRVDTVEVTDIPVVGGPDFEVRESA
jgi:acylphosphatase